MRLRGFKRFSDLTLELPVPARLVVLAGPNGVGKSSVLDGLRLWSGLNGAGWRDDAEYFQKTPEEGPTPQRIALQFHEPLQGGSEQTLKAVYVRSAYRNDPEFRTQSIQRAQPLLGTQTVMRMIDNDARVSDNYQRLVGLTIGDVYDGDHDSLSIGELREAYFGPLREALSRLFPDLELMGPGDPLAGGTFLFKKGSIVGYPYKNLSAGEKAAFDLLLDITVKREAYDDTVFCIDEPEAHLNTRIQGAVLAELFALMNENSQLWIATHSIGMLREAQAIAETNPDGVVFLDFSVADFDEPVTLAPTHPSRAFWTRTLETALGDLADLIAPRRLVLCEGKPVAGNKARSEFDARCFRAIFGDILPDTAFVSVGNSLEVAGDYLEIGAAFSAVISGATVIRVVDRDYRTPQEVNDLEQSGVRVLSRRHLEAFLLDDEVLGELCSSVGQPERAAEVVSIKAAAIAASIARGNDPDDLKSAAGEFFVEVRKALSIQNAGNTVDAFMADVLAPLVKPGLSVFAELKADIFGA